MGMNILQLQKAIGEWSESKGWRDATIGDRTQGPPRADTITTALAGVAVKHQEWSRVLEYIRVDGLPDNLMSVLLDPLPGVRGSPVNPLKVASKLALIHSEVTEALEATLDGVIHRKLIKGKPEGLDMELADVIIRCLELGDSLGLDIAGAISAKMEYNETREWRHGKKA